MKIQGAPLGLSMRLLCLLTLGLVQSSIMADAAQAQSGSHSVTVTMTLGSGTSLTIEEQWLSTYLFDLAQGNPRDPAQDSLYIRSNFSAAERARIDVLETSIAASRDRSSIELATSGAGLEAQTLNASLQLGQATSVVPDLMAIAGELRTSLAGLEDDLTGSSSGAQPTDQDVFLALLDAGLAGDSTNRRYGDEQTLRSIGAIAPYLTRVLALSDVFEALVKPIEQVDLNALDAEQRAAFMTLLPMIADMLRLMGEIAGGNYYPALDELEALLADFNVALEDLMTLDPPGLLEWHNKLKTLNTLVTAFLMTDSNGEYMLPDVLDFVNGLNEEVYNALVHNAAVQKLIRDTGLPGDLADALVTAVLNNEPPPEDVVAAVMQFYGQGNQRPSGDDDDQSGQEAGEDEIAGALNLDSPNIQIFFLDMGGAVGGMTFFIDPVTGRVAGFGSANLSPESSLSYNTTFAGTLNESTGLIEGLLVGHSGILDMSPGYPRRAIEGSLFGRVTTATKIPLSAFSTGSGSLVFDVPVVDGADISKKLTFDVDRLGGFTRGVLSPVEVSLAGMISLFGFDRETGSAIGGGAVPEAIPDYITLNPLNNTLVLKVFSGGFGDEEEDPEGPEGPEVDPGVDGDDVIELDFSNVAIFGDRTFYATEAMGEELGSDGTATVLSLTGGPIPGFTYLGWGSFLLDDISEGDDGDGDDGGALLYEAHIVYGTELTDPSGIPDSSAAAGGVASYTGVARGSILTGDYHSPFGFEGSVSLTVDFDTRDVDGQFDLVPDLGPAEIVTLILSDGGFDTDGNILFGLTGSGDFSDFEGGGIGRFYGPDGEEIGGTFFGTSGDEGGEEDDFEGVALNGVFGAMRGGPGQ